MIRKIYFLLIIIAVLLPAASFGQSVAFESSLPGPDGRPLVLTGELTRPAGPGPFPALVLLHGCGGVRPPHQVWASRFKEWGYVSLIVDSFNPRGYKRICDNNSLMLEMLFKRTQDARDAASFLKKLSFVKPDSLGIVGWSHGGSTVLAEIKDKNRDQPFQVAVAFYPYCFLPLINNYAPLLIVIGALDDWTPADRCLNMMPKDPLKDEHQVILKVLPDAYHGFDNEGLDIKYLGHHLKYNAQADREAQTLIKDFLGRRLP